MDQEVSTWFVLPWLDLRNAARLAAALCRLVVPQLPKAPSPLAKIEGEARVAIDRALAFLTAYAEDHILDWALPTTLSRYDGDDHMSRIYFTANDYGAEARDAAYELAPDWKRITQPRTAQEVSDEEARLDHWLVAGEATQEALNVVKRWAANSAGGGHAVNGTLERICTMVLDRTFIPFSEVELPVIRARFTDALHGHTATEELRLAFHAACDAGRMDVAYQLMTPAR